MYIFIATVFNWHKTLCKWLCYCCIYPTCVADILLINCWQNTTLRVMISDHWFLQNKNTFRLKTSQNSFLCTYCIWNKLHPHNICISIIPVKQVGAPDHEQLYNTTNANFGKLIMSEKICFVCLYCRAYDSLFVLILSEHDHNFDTYVFLKENSMNWCCLAHHHS